MMSSVSRLSGSLLSKDSASPLVQTKSMPHSSDLYLGLLATAIVPQMLSHVCSQGLHLPDTVPFSVYCSLNAAFLKAIPAPAAGVTIRECTISLTDAEKNKLPEISNSVLLKERDIAFRYAQDFDNTRATDTTISGHHVMHFDSVDMIRDALVVSLPSMLKKGECPIATLQHISSLLVRCIELQLDKIDFATTRRPAIQHMVTDLLKGNLYHLEEVLTHLLSDPARTFDVLKHIFEGVWIGLFEPTEEVHGDMLKSSRNLSDVDFFKGRMSKMPGKILLHLIDVLEANKETTQFDFNSFVIAACMLFEKRSEKAVVGTSFAEVKQAYQVKAVCRARALEAALTAYREEQSSQRTTAPGAASA